MDEMKMRLRETAVEHMPEARRLVQRGEEEIADIVRKTQGIKDGEAIEKRRGDEVFKWYLWALRHFGDMTLRDVAALFGMTPTAVSERVRRVEREPSIDKRATTVAQEIEKESD